MSVQDKKNSLSPHEPKICDLSLSNFLIVGTTYQTLSILRKRDLFWLTVSMGLVNNQQVLTQNDTGEKAVHLMTAVKQRSRREARESATV